MAADRHTYTTLSDDDAVTLILTINGTEQRFAVAQFTSTFALNAIPTASCALAIGRSGKTLQPAAIHALAGEFTSMLKARVVLNIRGEYRPLGSQAPGSAGNPLPPNAVHWPEPQGPGAELVIFEGYFTGSSYQKSANNERSAVYFVANLVHWVVDMGFTSFVSSVSHPSNAAELSYPAIFADNTSTTSGASTGAQPKQLFLPSLIGDEAITDYFENENDLWGAIKIMLCDIAKREGFTSHIALDLPDPNFDAEALEASLKDNSRAAKALARIEGPEGVCDVGDLVGMPYCYGKAVIMRPELENVFSDVAGLLHYVPFDLFSYTMWDVLVGYYFPAFQLDICPAIDRAVVIPRMPAYRAPNDVYWRTITTKEYSSTDQSAMLPKPLRAVVVFGTVTSDTLPNTSEPDGQAPEAHAEYYGAYAPPGIETDDAPAGAVLQISVPPWLNNINSAPLLPGTNTETNEPDGNKLTADTEAAAESMPHDETKLIDTEVLLSNYARSIYIENVLRGRHGNFSGKLRFDLAPGSHVKVEGSSEQFLTGLDVLAATMYGQVSRVTVVIDAEGQMAMTSFSLMGMRNAKENEDDRTSIDMHPFFTETCLGLPLSKSLAMAIDGNNSCPTP